MRSPIAIIDNIVGSFSFAVSDQILGITHISELQEVLDDSDVPRTHQDLNRLQHPERRSSLPPRVAPESKPNDPVDMLRRLEVKSFLHRISDDELNMVQIGEIERLAGVRADLLLLQRQVAEQTASRRGWKAGASRLQHGAATIEESFDEVNLHDGNDGSTAIEEKDDAIGTRGVLHPSLLEGLASFEAYCPWFESLTTVILIHCVLAIRLRTTEQLCADLAVLRYDAGDYTTALNYTSKILPAFAGGNWDTIEAGLSVIHLQCLKELNRKDSYVRMALNTLSKIATMRRQLWKSSHSQSSALSNIVTPLSEPRIVHVEDVLEASSALQCDVIVPVADFFDAFEMDPHIQHFEDRDGFWVTLSARFLLEEQIQAVFVRMKIRSTEAPFREFWLESGSSVSVTPGANRFELGAQVSHPCHGLIWDSSEQVVCSGIFTVEKLVVRASKISFEAENKKLASLALLETAHAHDKPERSILERLPQILCYSLQKNLAAVVRVSQIIHISRTRLLEIELRSGENEIQKGSLCLRAASAGLRLMTADAYITSSNTRLQKGKEPGTLELPRLEEESVVSISLPYDLETSLPSINISLEIQYTTTMGTFHHLSNPSVVVDLALDVSVHDLFKDDCLFSRFQIRASRAIPLLVTAVMLDETDHFDVEAPPCSITPLLVLPQQDGMVLYKIRPREQGQIDRASAKDERPLRLTVQYKILHENLLSSMQASLQNEVEKHGLSHFKPLLFGVLAKCCQSLSHEELEECALLLEFHLPLYDAMGWSEVLNGLHPTLRQRVGSVLESWHRGTSVLGLSLHDGVKDGQRQGVHTISIDVPLPRLQILHTARLLTSGRGFIAQGSVLTAQVSVRHTRRWETLSASVLASMSGHSKLRFVLEVDAPPDVWLLGGDRRTSFLAAEDEQQTFELILVPLKTGRLLLPEVNVRWEDAGEGEVRCETDFQSAAETVQVVAAMKSATVGVSEMAPGSEAAIAGCQRRQVKYGR